MFDDRIHAGQQLAKLVYHLRSPELVVVGLPRGGVPVAVEVAKALGAPLDVILVRKLGVPFQPELAMGAIGEDDVRVLNDRIIDDARVGNDELAEVESRERAELARRAQRYRSIRPRCSLSGRSVLIVDDGVATGSTARAACQVARAEGARRVVLAVPVAPQGWISPLAGEADEYISLDTPRDFFGVGQFYRDFSPTTDDDVIALLAQAATRDSITDRPANSDAEQHRDTRPRDEDVRIAIDHDGLVGHLTLPARARALVIFAHGSGSSRHSPRNRAVASALNEAGLGTLVFDLLTTEEERSRSNVFDIDLLGERLADVTRLVHTQPDLARLPVGLFGASTGAAAALRAAAEPDSDIAAIVSRGGRPDLAGDHLASVRSPTLLIVGGNDQAVLDLNRQARARLSCPSRLEVVPGATHLFEEPGALRQVADLAAEWFLAHLPPAPTNDRNET